MFRRFLVIDILMIIAFGSGALLLLVITRFDLPITFISFPLGKKKIERESHDYYFYLGEGPGERA